MAKPTKSRRRRTSARPVNRAPNVAWPGHGFEADPFSPAGQLESSWRFIDGLFGRGRSRGRVREAVRWLALSLLAVVAVVVVVTVIEAVIR